MRSERAALLRDSEEGMRERELSVDGGSTATEGDGLF